MTLGEKINPTGQVFNYSSIQTDILGLIVQGAAGKPPAEFFEEEFWSKLGAEHDAGFGTDGFGQPIAQDAISMTLPDFARAAVLVLNKGRNFQVSGKFPRFRGVLGGWPEQLRTGDRRMGSPTAS